MSTIKKPLSARRKETSLRHLSARLAVRTSSAPQLTSPSCATDIDTQDTAFGTSQRNLFAPPLRAALDNQETAVGTSQRKLFAAALRAERSADQLCAPTRHPELRHGYRQSRYRFRHVAKKPFCASSPRVSLCGPALRPNSPPRVAPRISTIKKITRCAARAPHDAVRAPRGQPAKRPWQWPAMPRFGRGLQRAAGNRLPPRRRNPKNRQCGSGRGWPTRQRTPKVTASMFPASAPRTFTALSSAPDGRGGGPQKLRPARAPTTHAQVCWRCPLHSARAASSDWPRWSGSVGPGAIDVPGLLHGGDAGVLCGLAVRYEGSLGARARRERFCGARSPCGCAPVLCPCGRRSASVHGWQLSS